ncbi:oxygenase MpaB family protein [Streptomyces plumbiresistens]|uniref:ER-bound oxygenase mpaB/mpaB'/Rubber oxygenase catalytic domain-containing protein n=1 Tax=Streptomyces plumbiresistens TaxID=511811 RepID=A0ABP7SKS2_9ACTN
MTSHHTPSTDSKRAFDLEAARRRHGAKADYMVTMLTAGDPLADAVITELDLHGVQAQRILDAGLKRGLASLDEPPPTAIAALLKQLESTPSWVDPLMLHRGDIVSQSVPPMWCGLCSITSALAHTYASPAVARLLARQGRPTVMASRQLVTTGVWARQTVRPGGLLRGAPGYMATVEIRLRHARMRAAALKDWDAGAEGLPIGQLDMARAWLGFTFIAFQALADVGIDITSEEERCLYQYWSYVAHLLGLDESLYGDVVDHASAFRLQDLLDRVTGVPDGNSRVLTEAMVDAQTHALAAAPGSTLSEDQLRALIHNLLRRALGDDTADRLGIPLPAATDLMPLITTLNRQSRYWQTFSPASAQAARRQELEPPEPGPMAAVLPMSIALQQTGVGRWAIPAA